MSVVVTLDLSDSNQAFNSAWAYRDQPEALGLFLRELTTRQTYSS